MDGRLPHVRGGVSTLYIWGINRAESSPRAWGCFLKVLPILSAACVFPTGVGVFLRFPPLWGSFLVFPTCVGVFPFRGHMGECARCLPHVRGGVSPDLNPYENGGRSSPRAWGCFLICPLWCAARYGLPHVRGGVSCQAYVARISIGSSPRAWGCFCDFPHVQR